MPGDIKSEWWATSSRIRGRLPPESAVVQKALGISAAGTFKNDGRRHPNFIEALDNHGVTEAWRNG
jgi:hypothetical protein